MSIFKTYFSKNNTIISNSTTNTAKNPVSEIFYGGLYSRMLLQIDLEPLVKRINDGFINRDSIQKHVLKLTNTINPTDSSFFNENTDFNTKRASSFTLVAFKLKQNWDEGVGYDYTDTRFQFPNQKTYSDGPSNWFNTDSMNTWINNGGKEENTVIGTQHFDNGNENIEIDITEYVNSVLNGDEEHYGIGIAFDEPYEMINTLESYRSVSFFSKYTQTFFEPYLETEFDDHFVDNRNDFYEGIVRNLILYVNQANEPTNLDDLPVVDIYDGDTVLLSDLETEHISKGVYKVSFKIDNNTCSVPKILEDVWKNISIDGYSISDIRQEFTLRSTSEYFNIGTDELNPKEYNYSFTGLKKDERIVSGDIRKVYVDVRVPFMYEGRVQIDGLKYRVYVKEGNTSIDVIPLTDINRAYNSNYFLLDTSMLIPNKEYHLDLQLHTNREINTYPREISFYVINQK
jgi:hypothetical protein